MKIEGFGDILIHQGNVETEIVGFVRAPEIDTKRWRRVLIVLNPRSNSNDEVTTTSERK